jgi:hypothetical protein
MITRIFGIRVTPRFITHPICRVLDAKNCLHHA